MNVTNKTNTYKIAQYIHTLSTTNWSQQNFYIFSKREGKHDWQLNTSEYNRFGQGFL
jgi:hypothetical protein